MLFILNHIRALAPKIHDWLWEATIIGDSQLVINQMTGEYRVKEEGLKPLFIEAAESRTRIEGRVQYRSTFSMGPARA